MFRKLCYVLAVVLVFGSAGNVLAGTWTNGDADNDWCNGLNWSGSAPSASVDATITGTPADEVIVTSGCDGTARNVLWTVDADQTFTVEAGGSLTIPAGPTGFIWRDGTATGTLNVYGNLYLYGLNEGSGTAGDGSFRGPDDGTGIVNVYPGGYIYCAGSFRGADNTGSYYEVYMTGGEVNTGWFKLGDNGSGNFYMTGGKFVTRRAGGESFTIRGRGGAEFEVLIDGGAELYVEGDLMTPQEPEAIANINIDNGTISCDEWVAQGYLWTVDINEGYLRIRNSDGTTKANVEQWIADGRITGYNGTVTPQITWDGPDLVVTVNFLHKTAYAPSPADDGGNICPGGSLTWGAGAYVTTHNIYFGTSLDDVNESATPLVTGYGPNTWSPPGLVLNEHYYWRVDEVNDLNPESPWTGGVWDFYTSDGNAFAVSPLNNQQNVPRSTNLTWSSCGGTLYDVYFSTEANDVRDRVLSTQIANDTALTTVDPEPGGELEYSTVYYWAVDIVGGSGGSGDVWNFRTETAIIDPNMTVWYKLDETSGDFVLDSSGYDNHGNADGGNWDPADGQFGGSFVCDDDAAIDISPLATAALDSSISVSCWLKNSSRPGDDNWVFGLGTGDYEVRAAVISGDNTNVEWRAGDDSNDVLLWNIVQAGIDPVTLSGWHHWVFVKDEVAGNMRMYFDSQVVAANSVVDATLSNLSLHPFTIGAASGHSSDLIGKIDDFRLFTKALTDDDVMTLFRGGEVELAYSPTPFTGQKDVLRDVGLSWKAGDFAVQHDVYFGTDVDAVTDANTAVPLGVYKGRQAIDANSYDPPGDLTLGTKYYWRIDEVNDACAASPWKGKIWTFTTANFVLIDDFEAYNDSDNIIYDTWLEDGSAWLDLGYGGDPARPGGEQSMDFLYFNNVDYGGGYYSEVGKALGGMDFTQAGVKSLTVFFYGVPTNAAGSTEEPYMGIDDGTTYAESAYTDTNSPGNPHLITDIQQAEWHEWNVPISDLNTVTLTSVQHIYIGFGQRGGGVMGGIGEVYFDNVRLYPPKCIPVLGPTYDWSGNCIVDLSDIGIMADNWLRTDAVLTSTAPTVGPVAWWELDDGSGTTAADSSVNSNTGTLEGSTTWVAGHIGSGAVRFGSDDARIRVPHSAELMPSTVSATAWIYPTRTTGESARVVAKGIDDGDWEAYYIQFDGSATWTVRDPNHNNQPDDGLHSDDLNLNEWTHVAGTYDGNAVKLYVNGQLEDEDTTGGLAMLQDSNDLSIGNRSDGNDRAFVGTIDDVRVYDYALSAEEVAYIATQGTGYIGLDTQVNIYDSEPAGQKAVNFRDLAKFMTSWLEEKLWPE